MKYRRLDYFLFFHSMPANSILKNRGLGIAIAVSVLIHAIVLSVKFVAPTASSFRPASSVIEVVLGGGGGGNATGSGTGGGDVSDVANAQVVMEKAPRTRVSKSNPAQGRPVEKRPVTSLSKKSNLKNIPLPDRKKDNIQQNDRPVDKGSVYAARGGTGGGRGEGDSVVFNRNARGGYAYGNDSGQAITSQTKDVGDALYFKSVQKKVENIGVINFPQKNGARLYGQLTVRINVYHDGSLYEESGGVSIVRSSGNPALDAAALNIVRRAAPFGRFKGTVRTIITRLNFTRDQGIRSQVVSTTS